MKIYIEKLVIHNLDNLIKKTIKYQIIYTIDGIYKIQNHNIVQLIPNDIAIEKYNNNNIDFIIDNSYYEYKKNVYHIPYNHRLCNIEENEYKLNKNSNISLIIEYNNQTNLKKFDQTNIYFSTNEKILDKNLKDNIIEYISLLNSNKHS